MLRSFKAMLGTYKEKDIIRAYRVGCGLCALVVLGVTTYDIHRSIKVNDTPPSKEQLESLAATIDESRRVMPVDEDSSEVHVVGLVSDTHGVLEEAVISALRGATSTVIHAGDVGDKRHKSRLSAGQVISQLAEGTGKFVVSVAGNVDEGCTDLPAWQTLNILGKKIAVIHISGFPPNNTAASEELVKSEEPDIVVFGHSHVPGVQKHNKTIYINPGSAGPRRFKLPRCISLLSIHKSGEVWVEFVSVGDLPQDVIALPKTFRDLVPTFQAPDARSKCVSPTPVGEDTDSNYTGNLLCRKRRKVKW